MTNLKMRYCRDIIVKNVIVGTPFFTSIFFCQFCAGNNFLHHFPDLYSASHEQHVGIGHFRPLYLLVKKLLGFSALLSGHFYEKIQNHFFLTKSQY